MKLATSYFGCRIPRHVKQDMDTLRQLGFDRVIHTFPENDLFYYADTMKEIISISHDAGLEVQIDPWGVAGIFGGEAFSRWIIEEPDLVQRGGSGRPLGGACLNHPRLTELMSDWIKAAAATGADWVFWDEPHWSPGGSPRNPDNEICTCEYCTRLSGSGEITESFRADSMLNFLNELINMAASCQLKSSVCVLPRGTMKQPPLAWPTIASLPGVLEFGTDPYWHAFNIQGKDQRDNFIDDNATAALSASRTANAQTQLWIQAFSVRENQASDLCEGIARICSHQPDTLAIWGFEACAHMSALACDQPLELWRDIISTIKTTPPGSGKPPDQEICS